MWTTNYNKKCMRCSVVGSLVCSYYLFASLCLACWLLLICLVLLLTVVLVVVIFDQQEAKDRALSLLGSVGGWVKRALWRHFVNVKLLSIAVHHTYTNYYYYYYYCSLFLRMSGEKAPLGGGGEGGGWWKTSLHYGWDRQTNGRTESERHSWNIFIHSLSRNNSRECGVGLLFFCLIFSFFFCLFPYW